MGKGLSVGQRKGEQNEYQANNPIGSFGIIRRVHRWDFFSRLPGVAVAKSNVEKVVRAEKFELVDGVGEIKAVLGTWGPGVTVFTFGEINSDNNFAIVHGNEDVYLTLKSKKKNGIYMASGIGGAKIDLVGTTFDFDKKISIRVDSDGSPTFRLSENEYQNRVVIGKTELKNTKTGSTEIRSTGSIVIFDEKGKVVYSVP